MTLKRVTSSLVIAAISAASLLPMANAANARDFGRHGGPGPQFAQKPFNGGKFHGNKFHGNKFNKPHFNNGGPQHRHAYKHKRRHHGRDIAIGAFAAMLGLAIAAQASRAYDNDYYYDDDRY